MDGHIQGPLGVGKYGEFVVRNRHLTGVFELDSLEFDTRKSPTYESPDKLKNKFFNKPDVGAWLSKDEVEKANHIFDKGRTSLQQTKPTTKDASLRITTLKNCRDTHDKSTCQYCGLIHYALNSNKPDNSPNAQKNSQTTKARYWPQQFTNHFAFDSKRERNAQNIQNIQSSKAQRQPPSSISNSSAAKNQRDVHQSLNLAVPNQMRKPIYENRFSDNHFETTIPITLKGFKGDVKTEIEVLEGKNPRQPVDHCLATEPLVIVATKVKVQKFRVQ